MYPTTRKARFIERREKHRRRGLKEQRRRHRTYVFGNRVSDVTVSRLYPTAGKLLPHGLTATHFKLAPPPVIRGPLHWYVLSPVSRGSPLHVRMVAGFYLAAVAAGHHFRFAIAGVHVRTVKRRMLFADRMNGAARRVWGATMFARVNGFYPDWDVLGRQPSETAVANGAPELPQTQEPYWTSYQPYDTST